MPAAAAVPRGVGSDPALIRLLDESFAAMKPSADAIAVNFYGKLFAHHPALRSMFPADMTAQRRKLMESLGMVIEGLRAPDAMKQRLRDLGARHTGYGARPEHYPIVCELLLESMRELSPGWSPLIESEWRRALQLISSIMLGGASAVGATPRV
jgi:hemoglobin-like flavoprotein